MLNAELYNPHLRNPPPHLYGGYGGLDPVPPGERESGIGTARALVRLAAMLKRLGIKEEDVRIGKQQVHGTEVKPRPGTKNKPDLSFVRNGKRYNIEIDTTLGQSRKHEKDILKNKTKDRTYFLMIDPRTGRIQDWRTYAGDGRPAVAQGKRRFTRKQFDLEAAGW
jgi:hypothetical protein